MKARPGLPTLRVPNRKILAHNLYHNSASRSPQVSHSWVLGPSSLARALRLHGVARPKGDDLTVLGVGSFEGLKPAIVVGD